ncbi:hypothetical protein [Microbacterium sp. LM3X-1.2]|uniref:hypothetical protein n=2 Tax=Microbacterium TaxID=33882 RepID=UPI00343D0AD7
MREDERMTDDDERFQRAGHASRRLVAQCLAHVRSATSKLPGRIDAAPSWTDYGVDLSAAVAGSHVRAFRHRGDEVESTCNALVSHLEGLRVLVDHDTLHSLPAITITRSIAEVSASTSWLLCPGLSADERAARAYAALFRSVESSKAASPETSGRIRERLILELAKAGVRIQRAVDKHKNPTDEVAQVLVGRSNAKTRFQFTQRIADEIPALGTMYGTLSGIAHGEHLFVSTSWETPDTYARAIGVVTYRAVEAWSRSIHEWVGVTAAPFLNGTDIHNLLQSIPSDLREEFETEASD